VSNNNCYGDVDHRLTTSPVHCTSNAPVECARHPASRVSSPSDRNPYWCRLTGVLDQMNPKIKLRRGGKWPNKHPIPMRKHYQFNFCARSDSPNDSNNQSYIPKPYYEDIHRLVLRRITGKIGAHGVSVVQDAAKLVVSWATKVQKIMHTLTPSMRAPCGLPTPQRQLMKTSTASTSAPW